MAGATTIDAQLPLRFTDAGGGEADLSIDKGVPVSIGTENSEGDSANVARGNHVHKHDDQSRTGKDQHHNEDHNDTQHLGYTPWQVPYIGGTGAEALAALGASGTLLRSKGASTAPAFETLVVADVPYDDGTSDPVDTTTAAADGTEASPARKDHAHKLHDHDHTGDAGDGAQISHTAALTNVGNLTHLEAEETINKGVHSAITVTDQGGVNVTWSSGVIFDHTNDVLVPTAAEGSNQACAVNDTTYLYWVSGSTLTLSTTPPSGDNVPVAHITCSADDIIAIDTEAILGIATSQMREGLAAVFETIVANGLVISEDTDVTNALDVSLSAGSFAHEDFAIHVVGSPILSRSVPLIRWYRVGGAWVTDTNAEINEDYYDDGSDLVEITGGALNKYYKSAFYTDGVNIHWVYPNAGYNTIAQAIGALVPTPPDALAHQPSCTAVILKGSDSAFPTAGGEQWEDIRPRLGVANPSTVEDHGSLSGITAAAHHAVYLDAEALAAAKAGAGISDDDLVQVDGPGAGAPANGEYAKWTASGLEGKTAAEVMGDLSGQSAANFDLNSKKITGVSAGTGAGEAAIFDQINALVAKNLFDAQTILSATSDNTPVALAIAEQRLVGRLTGGNVAALTIGIADDNIPQVDGPGAGAPANGEFALWTAAGLEGKTAAEVRALLGSGAKQSIMLTAAGGRPTTTAGCGGSAQIEAGTNDVDYAVLEFDKDTDEFAFWGPPATPDNWDGGTLTAVFYWTTAAGGAAETVRWSIQMAARDDGEDIDDAWGAAVTVDDTWIGDGKVHKSAVSGAITPDTAGTRAGGDLLFVRVMRDVSGDDLGGDARLIGVKLEYGINDLSS